MNQSKRNWARIRIIHLLVAVAVAALALAEIRWSVGPRITSVGARVSFDADSIRYAFFKPNERDEIEFQRFRRAQADLMRSRPLLQAVLRSPGIAELPVIRRQSDPVVWLQQDLLVRDMGGSQVILVMPFPGTDLEEKADLINAVLATYFKLTGIQPAGERRFKSGSQIIHVTTVDWARPPKRAWLQRLFDL